MSLPRLIELLAARESGTGTPFYRLPTIERETAMPDAAKTVHQHTGHATDARPFGYIPAGAIDTRGHIIGAMPEPKPKPRNLRLSEAENGGWSVFDASRMGHGHIPDAIASFSSAADLLEGLGDMLGCDVTAWPETEDDNGVPLTAQQYRQKVIDELEHDLIAIYGAEAIVGHAPDTAQATAPEAAEPGPDYRKRLAELLGAVAGGDPQAIAIQSMQAAHALNR